MDEGGNKTIMCSVLFLDISEYSRKQVAEQIALKEAFNSFLAKAISDIPANDRIILDTGDGAAISFLGDISDAFKVVLSLRESFFQEGAMMSPPLLVRMGVNLGPVRLVRDINGQPNIVGDGINVAQRIMGFADTGQALVSRSYYDAVSRISKEYAGMFHYQGLRTDKHVREHEVFAIGFPGEFSGTWKQALTERWYSVVATFQNASTNQRALYISLPVAIIVLLFVVVIKMLHRPVPVSPPVAVAVLQPVSAPAASAVREVLPEKDELTAMVNASGKIEAEKKAALAAAPKSKAENTAARDVEKKPKAVAAAEKKPVAAGAAKKQQKSALSARDLPKHAPASAVSGSAPKPVSIAAVRTVEETAAIESKAPAIVSLAITPWGEVYLDGRMQGVSPPLVELQVVPGKHEIEIRNSTFPSYSEKVHLKASETLRIKYKFSN